MSCLVYFEEGNVVLVDMEAIQSSQTEYILRNFIERNAKWNPYVVNFEGEGGSSPTYALRYWQGELADITQEYGIIVKKTQATTVGSKYTRAIPHAHLMREGRLFFDIDLDNTVGLYNPLRTLFNQYIYVHPQKEVMEEHPSPDELDSVSYAFSEMQSVIQF